MGWGVDGRRSCANGWGLVTCSCYAVSSVRAPELSRTPRPLASREGRPSKLLRARRYRYPDEEEPDREEPRGSREAPPPEREPPPQERAPPRQERVPPRQERAPPPRQEAPRVCFI